MLLRRLWAAEEENLLREWATKISVNRIAIRLKRSPSAVKSRALELGLSLSVREVRHKPIDDRETRRSTSAG